ncbi:hypothetical protein F4824DRAFT_501078 [Ustulina deusta]|nr:hypothetical protein F4824DRAFT_501078 [Ustulina deusta]
MSKISIRKPQPLPPCAFDPAQRHSRIQFLHPGYNNGDNVLLELPCVDSTDSGWGVHYLTALTACQTLAGNAWNGYLALDTQGQQHVGTDLSWDTALTKPQYWFVVRDRPEYAVVPNFQEWRFPPDLPAAWPSPVGLASSDDVATLFI